MNSSMHFQNGNSRHFLNCPEKWLAGRSDVEERPPAEAGTSNSASPMAPGGFAQKVSGTL